MATTLASVPAAQAAHDMDFAIEHLAESLMDDRLATLPLWSSDADGHIAAFDVSLGGTLTRTGGIDADGPMLGIGGGRQLSERIGVLGFGFYDRVSVSASSDRRPLQPLFTDALPFAAPVDAVFNGNRGELRQWGVGAALTGRYESGRFGPFHWRAGAFYEQLQLAAMRFDYQLLSGPDTGLNGTVDYSATYRHVVPFLGVEKPWRRANWLISPQLLLAMPLPRRAMDGTITGPGFVLAGNTEATGAGKHFGDPYVVFGAGITYMPWHLTLDAGALVAQAVVEPFVHEGLGTHWVLNLHWRQAAAN
ncbi:MAG: hypothetical protein R3E77_01580 [Steroidobacteraceae bacterium]